MKLNSLGSNLAALNNYEPPSGIAGKIIEDSIIGKAVEGIGEGLGVAGIFEDATKNIVKGLGVVTSPVTRLLVKKNILKISMIMSKIFRALIKRLRSQRANS